MDTDGLTVYQIDSCLRRLIAEIQDIDRQLGGRATSAPDNDYRDWRRRALYARNKRLQEYRRLKEFLALKRTEDALSGIPEELDIDDASQLLRETYRLARRLLRQNPLTEDDYRVLDLVREHLRKGGLLWE